MSHLLNLAMAARLVGSSRREVQKKIQQGELQTFEGQIRVDELLRVYQNVQLHDATMLEKVRAIKEQAIYKHKEDPALPSAEVLMEKVRELNQELVAKQQQLNTYQTMVGQLQHKLETIEQQCDHKDKMLLQSLIAWLASSQEQSKQHYQRH